MLTDKTVQYLTVSLITITLSYFFAKWQHLFDDSERDEYEMIRKYLLNDSPLYGQNKPKLWIHTEFDLNARIWKEYGGRLTREMNRPFLQFTIQSIINHCAQDFHVCLIDDESFENLLPGWSVRIDQITNPVQQQYYRELGKLSLLYTYGGMLVPNSMVCWKSLYPLYHEHAVQSKHCFVGESRVHSFSSVANTATHYDITTTQFMGAPKNHESVKEYMQWITQLLGSSVRSLQVYDRVLPSTLRESLTPIDARVLGLATTDTKRPVTLDELMEEKPILIQTESAYGIILPHDELMSRHKYSWFVMLTPREFAQFHGENKQSVPVIIKYLQYSMIAFIESPTGPSLSFAESSSSAF